MNSDIFSIIVKCWRDTPTGKTHIQVIRTDSAQEVFLENSTFLVRVQRWEAGRLDQYYIRHIASGRDAYVQGGPSLRDFIKTCLLNGGLPETEESGVVGDIDTTI